MRKKPLGRSKTSSNRVSAKVSRRFLPTFGLRKVASKLRGLMTQMLTNAIDQSGAQKSSIRQPRALQRRVRRQPALRLATWAR